MPLTEEELLFLEAQIPQLAAGAARQAFLDALAAGRSVLIAEEGQLIELFPDGRRQVVRQLDAKPQFTERTEYTIR